MEVFYISLHIKVMSQALPPCLFLFLLLPYLSFSLSIILPFPFTFSPTTFVFSPPSVHQPFCFSLTLLFHFLSLPPPLSFFFPPKALSFPLPFPSFTCPSLLPLFYRSPLPSLPSPFPLLRSFSHFTVPFQPLQPLTCLPS